MSDEPAIPVEAVRAELERVLASKGFQNAGRLSRLLRHVTEKTLAGSADQLKEYALGVDVFDRDASYDPRLDSIVRVEAGRLRSRLDDYYANGGVANEIRIDLPRGGYVPHFIRRASPVSSVDQPVASVGPPITTAEPAMSSRRPRRPAALAAVSAVAVIVFLLWLSPWKSQSERPAVAVLPFSEYSGASLAGVAASLTDEVTSELARLGRVDVVSHTSARQFASAKKPLREIADVLNARFVVEATLVAEPAGIKVVARIVDAATDRKVWVQDYHGRPDALHDLSRAMADDIATAVLTRQPTR